MNAKCPRCGFRQSLDFELPELSIDTEVEQYKVTCKKCKRVYYVDVEDDDEEEDDEE
jgi:hypothetical protein